MGKRMRRRSRPARAAACWPACADSPEEVPDADRPKLIAYDFDKYGSSAERNRLLGRWTKDVKNAQSRAPDTQGCQTRA
jgi:hypothetical protein